MKIFVDNAMKKVTESKLSYKESFLATLGLMNKDNIFSNETINKNESDLEDQWYKEDEDLLKREKYFDPCPKIKKKKTVIMPFLRTMDSGRILFDSTKMETVFLILRATSEKDCSVDLICVEIDLSKKLVSRISVLDSTLNIEYEGFHLICFNCEVHAHRSELCRETPAAGKDH
ncbi:hypothetical protein AHAS_Ahas15G0341700 [Arachis hypogaea]